MSNHNGLLVIISCSDLSVIDLFWTTSGFDNFFKMVLGVRFQGTYCTFMLVQSVNIVWVMLLCLWWSYISLPACSQLLTWLFIMHYSVWLFRHIMQWLIIMAFLVLIDCSDLFVIGLYWFTCYWFLLCVVYLITVIVISSKCYIQLVNSHCILSYRCKLKREKRKMRGDSFTTNEHSQYHKKFNSLLQFQMECYTNTSTVVDLTDWLFLSCCFPFHSLISPPPVNVLNFKIVYFEWQIVTWIHYDHASITVPLIDGLFILLILHYSPFFSLTSSL